MRDRSAALAPARLLTIGFEPGLTALGDDVLAAIAFGEDVPVDDPRWLRVGLPRLAGAAGCEVWRVAAPVRHGRDGAIRYATGGGFAFGAIELDEAAHGGIEGAARAAYDDIVRHLARSPAPHLLRVWNYFDAINAGADDEERYRRFCVGRALGLAPVLAQYFPAATAIGRRDGDARLQVYWLAGARAGTPMENPRQVSAYRYPRQYGPVSPSFSRAMLVDDATLLISGTSSVVGHETHHAGDVGAQLDETLRNLDLVLRRAHEKAAMLPPRFGAHSALKVYLRDPAAVDPVTAMLRERLAPGVSYVVLSGEICRADLGVEIDGTHFA